MEGETSNQLSLLISNGSGDSQEGIPVRKSRFIPTPDARTVPLMSSP